MSREMGLLTGISSFRYESKHGGWGEVKLDNRLREEEETPIIKLGPHSKPPWKNRIV